MTQEEIIELVMQIGGCDRPEENSPALKMFVTFATLVAEKAIKEALAKLVLRLYTSCGPISASPAGTSMARN